MGGGGSQMLRSDDMGGVDTWQNEDNEGRGGPKWAIFWWRNMWMILKLFNNSKM